MDKNAETQYFKICEIFELIPLDGQVTILTGSNGSGKSLIRGQLPMRLREHPGKPRLIHASQELRTASNSSLGAMSSFAHDLPWLPTSVMTIHTIKQVMKHAEGNYLVIDEPEIGCGEETVMAMAAWLNDQLSARPASCWGVLIITHSRYMVQNLRHDYFFNLDGYDTAEAWLNRPLIPTDLAALEENPLFGFIRDLEKEKRGKK